MVHGVNVLSPHAHARIKKVDVSKAKAAPGVLLVLTGADVAADHLGTFTSAMMPEDIGAHDVDDHIKVIQHQPRGLQGAVNRARSEMVLVAGLVGDELRTRACAAARLAW